MPISSLLAIETSVSTGSVALFEDREVKFERSFTAGRKPSATLWPALEEVMSAVETLDAIVVGIGPGSYNGSRIGIAAAQGIALVHDCGIAPICSFEGVLCKGRKALAIGDARRGNYSLQNLVEGRVEGPFSLVDQEELLAAVARSHAAGEDVFSFDPAERFPLDPPQQEFVTHRQSSAGLLASAFAGRSAPEQEALLATPAEPFYLRAPHITVGKRQSLLNR